MATKAKPKKKAAVAVKPPAMTQAEWLKMQATLAAQQAGNAVAGAGQAVGQEVGRDLDAAKRLYGGAKDLLNVDEIAGGGR